MYKLIFIDIDGTMLTSDHTISPGTSKAIKRVTETLNIPVVLATARPPQAVTAIYEQLNINSPVICFNGALILDSLVNPNPQIMLSAVVDASRLNHIIDTATKYSVSTNFYKMKEWFSNAPDDWIKQEEEITETKVTIINIAEQIKQWATENDGPHKILFMGQPDDINALESALKMQTPDLFNIYQSKPTYLEMVNRSVSKKEAVAFVTHQYGCIYKDIIAIGDNYNDIAMLQSAGLGIAMGNAPDAVKARSNFVTLDNDSEGIQFALNKFIP